MGRAGIECLAGKTTDEMVISHLSVSHFTSVGQMVGPRVGRSAGRSVRWSVG